MGYLGVFVAGFVVGVALSGYLIRAEGKIGAKAAKIEQKAASALKKAEKHL